MRTLDLGPDAGHGPAGQLAPPGQLGTPHGLGERARLPVVDARVVAGPLVEDLDRRARSAALVAGRENALSFRRAGTI